MDRTANDNNLLQIARLQVVDRFYTQMLKACGFGIVVGAVWYGVVFFAAGA